MAVWVSQESSTKFFDWNLNCDYAGDFVELDWKTNDNKVLDFTI